MFNMIEKSKKNLKNKKGFTLIELIVVIVILGILAAIAIPRLAGFSENANQATDKEAMAVLANAGSMYYASHLNDSATAPTGGAIHAGVLNEGLVETKDLLLKSKKYGPGSISAGALTVSGGSIVVTVGDYKVIK